MNLPITIFKALFIFCCYSVTAQNNSKVIITAVKDVQLDTDCSYIYCSSMEIMWSELKSYLNEEPYPCEKNHTIGALNDALSNDYKFPIEDSFFVANAGLVKDSVRENIDKELKAKFNTHWYTPPSTSQDAIVAYSYLKRNVDFRFLLDDEFNAEPFDKKAKVDYFGVAESDPNHKRKDILIHDYKGGDDFIVQVKCKDSLDEIYFAKVKHGTSLKETYENVIKRVEMNNSERFCGSDILKIPYIKFDTTASFNDLEGVKMCNKKLDGRSFQIVQQRISFDLNPQGIKLESSVRSLIDFADFEMVPPRTLAFNKPFLIVMKRSGFDNPYFLYWVDGTEFMRNYVLPERVLSDEEFHLVGSWKLKEFRTLDNIKKEDMSLNHHYTFYDNGTFEYKSRNIENKESGAWYYSNNIITLVTIGKGSVSEKVLTWNIEEISENQFIVSSSLKLVFERKD